MVRHSLAATYQTLSSASADQLWRKVVDIADVSWNPLIAGTNLPSGLIAKPGLIYRAVARRIPLPIRVFVEKVQPGQLLSVRLMMVAGLEERVTYHIASTVWGTQITCSVTLSGWLSPLVWSIIQAGAARLALGLARAAEQTALSAPRSKDLFD